MKSLKTVKRIAVSSAGAVSLAIANAHKAAADQIQDVQSGVNKVATDTGAATDLTENIGNIINIMIGVIGIAAVIMLIIGGFRYVFSQGDEKGVKGAKDTILYSIIGIVVALLAFAIVNFVLGGLQGTS